MIKHIVMWKLKDFDDEKEKIENARKAKELLEGLKDKIDIIDFIEVGINISKSNSAFDLVLYSGFNDLKTLDEYQNHQEHLKVGDFIASIRKDRVVVDYEV